MIIMTNHYTFKNQLDYYPIKFYYIPLDSSLWLLKLYNLYRIIHQHVNMFPMLN